MANRLHNHAATGSRGAGRGPSERATLAIVVLVLMLSLAWLMFTTGMLNPGRRSPSPAEVEAARKAHAEEQAHIPPLAPGSEPSSS